MPPIPSKHDTQTAHQFQKGGVVDSSPLLRRRSSNVRQATRPSGSTVTTPGGNAAGVGFDQFPAGFSQMLNVLHRAALGEQVRPFAVFGGASNRASQEGSGAASYSSSRPRTFGGEPQASR